MALLHIDGLTLSFRTPHGHAQVLDEMGLIVEEGEIMGLVGESGSGKSVTALAVMGLLPPGAVVQGGAIRWRGEDVLAAPPARLARLRGKSVAMVFQSPGTSLNPLLRIGAQLHEVLGLHRDLSGRAARHAAFDLMERVGLAARVLDLFPHELSGGMQQRAYIALALAGHPELLIADEPTSSLDVSVQRQILDLLRQLRRDGHIRSILLITHDLGVVDALCDSITVLYAGQVVESGPARAVLEAPVHPYTAGLIAAIPRLDADAELTFMRGGVPDLRNPPAGCRFQPRCDHAYARCGTRPGHVAVGPGRQAACHLLREAAHA